MAYDTIDLDVRGGVAHLTLNRPDAANGINAELSRDLFDATLDITSDPRVRAVLLTGAGKRFCGGGDLKAFADQEELPRHLRETLGFLHGAIAQLVRGDAPVVAAVQGSAAGAGIGLIGASDLVVAGESARFVMAYTGVGLTPDGASSWVLPRLVGLRRAMELTLTNRVLSAAEALDWGLITRVVADDDLPAEAEALATSLAGGATRALAGAKRLLHASLESSFESHLAREGDEIFAAAGRVDAVEGITAFVEKRPPQFRGE
jgi:2-(1,2-epoxy-1,2-dihydrophenyl)acetyl-CoA isomerase